MNLPCSGQPAGIPARRPGYFLCFAKESNQRKATPMPAPLGCAKGFPAVREEQTPARNALRSLRSLRLNGRAESVLDARCARGSALLCSSAWHRGPLETVRLSAARAVRLLAVWGSPYAKPSSARAWGSARSAPPQQIRRGRSSAANPVSEARSAPPPRPEQRREPIAAGERRRHRGSPFFSPLFFGEAKKRGSGAGVKPLRVLT
ncbi:hypothetical protein HNQ51_001630 [Inhella inkyongensis]|uniref:Uncharacterized protein n=1 Tax=Inhella inkyongensis TaxID=392593 RepID=A0A840S5M5_9BURK|nr:hypothetical protein [Inhella inkyongensis]